jgi:hypothetical protein
MRGRSSRTAARSPQRARTGRACAGRTRRERKGRRSPGLDRVTAASSISNCPNLPFRRFLHLQLRATETELAAALSVSDLQRYTPEFSPSSADRDPVNLHRLQSHSGAAVVARAQGGDWMYRVRLYGQWGESPWPFVTTNSGTP